jgi:hypothetical protein
MLKALKDINIFQNLLQNDIIPAHHFQRYPLLILFKDEKNTYLNEDEENFLEKILSAIQLDLDTIKLLNVAQNDVDFANLADIPAKKVISFGVNWKDVSINLQANHYQIAQPAQSYQFLQANSLHNLINNPIEKKQLWDNLKKMFF